MRLLFLTISDQQHHPLNRYADLHCTYDFRSWESGFRAVCSHIYIHDYYASFVSDGPFGMESHVRKLVNINNIEMIIVPNMYYELAPSFLNELRKLGCKSVVTFFDDSVRFEETNRFYLSSFDYYVAHDYMANKTLYIPHGIHADFFPVVPSHSFYKEITQHLDKKCFTCANDVVFVGAKIADRDVFIDYLKDNHINISVYGKGWDTGMCSTEEMLAAFNASKVSLNFIKVDGDSGLVQLKGRLFEIIMAGGFVLSEHSDELTEYFDIGDEIDTFRSPQELLDKVRFYLENDDLRQEMSTRAKTRVDRNYSFESNWLRYLSDIKNGTIKTSYPNPSYQVPTTAMNSFFNWNLSLIYGRFMLGQYRLAYEQYTFCRRELDGLAANIGINTLFWKMMIKRLMIMFTHLILGKTQVQWIRHGYSRFRKLVFK